MRYVSYSFFVPDIRCIQCSAPIKDALKACRELNIHEDIDIDDKEVRIQVPEPVDELFLQHKIKEVLQSIHYRPVFSEALMQEQTIEQTQHHWRFGAVGTVSGFVLLLVSMLFAPLPMALMIPVTLGSGVITLILGAASYQRAYSEWLNLKRAIAQREWNIVLTMDSLFAVSTLVVLLVSVASFFVPWLPMMAETGLLIFGFRHLGLAIEGSLTRVMQFNTRFVDRLPETIRVIQDEQRSDQPIQTVLPGQEIEIQPGQIIPLDGQCLSSDQWIYDDIVTGAVVPRLVQNGEQLISGMRLAEGGSSMRLKVTEAFKTAYLNRLDQRISHIKFENKSDFELFSKRLLSYFIPAVFILSIVSAGVLAYLFPLAVAIRCAIAVLVSACPCTLGLVVPLAVKIGMRKSSEHGVQFRSKEQLQRAGEVDCVVLDLNGTLTTGKPTITVEPVIDQSQISEETFFQVAAMLEKSSTHPYAQVIYQHALAKNLTELESPTQRHHFGVTAMLNEQRYCIGNQMMMKAQHIDTETYLARHNLIPQSGMNIVYLALNQRIVGHYLLSDPLRPEAKHMVDSLKALGKKVFICTGADRAVAECCAKSLGIPLKNVRAGQRGTLNKTDADDDKSTFIRKLKKKGYRVAMVGDAGNDALAIAESTFGVALRSAGGDKVAQAEAGAVIYAPSLLPVISAFEISKQAVTQIKQNLAFSLGYNLITELLVGGVLPACGVMLNPSVGVVLMIVQMCLILGNSYRFNQQPLSYVKTSPIADVVLEQSTTRCRRGLGLTVSSYDLNIDPAPSAVKKLWQDPSQNSHQQPLATRVVSDRPLPNNGY